MHVKVAHVQNVWGSIPRNRRARLNLLSLRGKVYIYIYINICIKPYGTLREVYLAYRQMQQALSTKRKETQNILRRSTAVVNICIYLISNCLALVHCSFLVRQLAGRRICMEQTRAARRNKCTHLGPRGICLCVCVCCACVCVCVCVRACVRVYNYSNKSLKRGYLYHISYTMMA